MSAQPIWAELVLKCMYVTGLILNIVGLITGSSILRSIALPLCPASLSLLVLHWHRRIGWSNPSYACCVLLGFLFNLLGDLVLSEPRDDYLAYCGFALFVTALFCFTCAFNLPSLPHGSNRDADDAPTVYSRLLEGVSPVPSTRTSPPPPPVSVRPARGLGPVILIVAALILWRVGGGAAVSSDPRYAVTACLVVVQAIMVWRALARIGYAAPLVTVSGLLRARRRRKTLQGITDDEQLRPQAGTPRRSVRLDGGGSDEDEDGAGGTSSTFDPSPFAYDDAEEDDLEDEDGAGDSWSGAAFGSLVFNRGRSGLSLKRGSRRMRQQRRERNHQTALEEAAAVESRWYQWAAVVGSVLLAIGLIALGYDQFWMDDDFTNSQYMSSTATELTYAYSILAWLGQTLIAASVPCELPLSPGMDDESVCPPPTDGPPLRIVMVLPAEDFDIAEVAVPWYVLTRRGHTVLFASREGLPGIQLAGRLPLPLDVSAHGYGCASAACSSGGDAGCCGRPSTGANSVPGRSSAACCSRRNARGARTAASPISPSSSSTSSRSGILWCLQRVFCCGDMCTAESVAIGLGAPGPLVVAMYREMLESETFRAPLAWSRSSLESAARRLPRRARKRPKDPSRRVSRTSNASELMDDGAPQMDAAAVLLAEQLLVPDVFDGMLVVGAHPAATQMDVWDDAELQDLVARFWDTGRPLGMFSNAVLLLARCMNPASGQPLMNDVMLTATPAWMEWNHAALAAGTNCRWAPVCRLACGSRNRRHASVEAEVTATLQSDLKLVLGPSPMTSSNVMEALVHNQWSLVREPHPNDDAHALVVEDGAFISAQCGGDAFLMVRRFMAKLEEVQRTF